VDTNFFLPGRQKASFLTDRDLQKQISEENVGSANQHDGGKAKDECVRSAVAVRARAVVVGASFPRGRRAHAMPHH